MQQAYFLVFWDISRTRMQGPYDSYATAFECKEDRNDDESTAVIGPLPVQIVYEPDWDKQTA